MNYANIILFLISLGLFVQAATRGTLTLYPWGAVLIGAFLLVIVFAPKKKGKRIKLTCAFCGRINIVNRASALRVAAAHMEVCEHHPMAMCRKRRIELETEILSLRTRIYAVGSADN